MGGVQLNSYQRALALDEYYKLLKYVEKLEQLPMANVVGQSEQCIGCDESTGETKLWCCNHCGKRVEDF